MGRVLPVLSNVQLALAHTQISVLPAYHLECCILASVCCRVQLQHTSLVLNVSPALVNVQSAMAVVVSSAYLGTIFSREVA